MSSAVAVTPLVHQLGNLRRWNAEREWELPQVEFLGLDLREPASASAEILAAAAHFPERVAVPLSVR